MSNEPNIIKESGVYSRLNTEFYSQLVSYLFIGIAILGALHFDLVGAFISGCLVYSITQNISNKMESKWQLGKISRTITVFFLVCLISLFLSGLVFGIIHFLKGTASYGGASIVLSKSADILDTLRQTLPPSISGHIPSSMDAIKTQAVIVMKENSHSLSTAGVGFFHHLARYFVGIVIGAMLSFHVFRKSEDYKPLSRHFLNRLHLLKESFNKVVYAQVKISLVNTIITGIYIMVILPLFGIHLPLSKTLIAITFVAGLIPVIGNLISNTMLVLISTGVSLKIGIISLVFLILIHKMEYFLNAKIIGSQVNAVAWELLFAMFIMEVVFGFGGVIAAPIVYAYIKSELNAYHLVGTHIESKT